MNAQQLRASILQMAIEGRLVPQDPNDKPVEIDSKDVVLEEEQPFAIPENWRWVRIGDTVLCRDGERIPVKASDREKQKKIYNYYGAAGVIDKVENYLFDKRLLLVGEDGANLLSRRKPNAFFADGKYWVNNHAHILDETPLINLDFLANYINAISLSAYVTGTAQPKLTQKKLLNIPLPLPPLSEQKRIVARIEELLPLVETYGEAQEHLEKLDKELPNKMKQSILQTAIQGKLVPQDPNDKPVEIDSKAIVPEEEQPFAIPENWRWVRLSEVISKASQKVPDRDFLYIDVGSIRNDIGQLGVLKRLKSGEAPSRARKIVNEGNVLYSTVRPYLLNTCVAENLPEGEEIIASTGFAVMVMKPCIEGHYLHFLLRSEFFSNFVKEKQKGVAYPAINEKDFMKAGIPLPPLAEQKRIVDCVEKLFKEIDELTVSM